MKMMIWKELRENFKWAMLAMIGLALAEIYGLYYTDQNNPNNQGITLLNPTFLMATSLGNAVAGLLLGLVQILPEQRRDQWAALLHRPVTRGVIFRGKALAGFLLYLLAAVPPFLFCWWLAATPGHFVAPYVPGLVYAGLSDIFIGATYYFAALVVGLQRGSWFGARTFALLSAVYLSCSVSAVHYFYVVTEGAVILALILFAAAWGAMLSNGKFRDRPWLTRAALLAAVFYGICGVGGLAAILVNAIQQPEPYVGAEYKITQDGQPIIVSNNKDLTTTVTDLAGNPIHDARYTGRLRYGNEIFENQITYLIGDSHGFDPRHVSSDYYNYRLSYWYISEIESYGSMQPIQWFYLEGPRYVTGIDRRSKTVTQIVDRTGFHAPGLPIDPFTGERSHWYDVPCLVQDGNDAYMCDLDKQLYTKLPSADPSPIFGFQLFSYEPTGGKGSDMIIVVARQSGLQLYDSNGALITTIPYDPQINLDRWGKIWFGLNRSATSFYVRYTPSSWLPWEEQQKTPAYLDEVDAKGTVLHSYTLPPLPEPGFPRSWQTYLTKSLYSPAFWFWDLAYKKIGAALGIPSLIGEEHHWFHTNWSEAVDISTRVVIYSLLFAAIGLAWARSAGMAWRRALAWAAFVLAFNLGGLLTFRLVADWPARVPCPKCQKKRPVEEPACPHCQSGWPTPARHGLEIFDDNALSPATETARN